MNRYSYADLKEKAMSKDATQGDLANLADWLLLYDPQSWNGFYYDLDDGRTLNPFYILDENGEPDSVVWSIW